MLHQQPFICARAANGVVLVTTKQGKAGKLQISYDGYVGFQYLYKHPDVLNAKEYMYAYDLMNWTDGSSTKDWQSLLPASEWEQIQNGWEGTDWVNASYHKGAVKTNHSIGLQGGNDISKFSLGFAYTKQDGIFGETRQSKFERYNVRFELRPCPLPQIHATKPLNVLIAFTSSSHY